MSPENFIYWLRGFYELSGQDHLTEAQSRLVSKHLTLCFKELAKDLPTISEAGKREATLTKAYGVLPTISCQDSVKFC